VHLQLSIVDRPAGNHATNTFYVQSILHNTGCRCRHVQYRRLLLIGALGQCCHDDGIPCGQFVSFSVYSSGRAAVNDIHQRICVTTSLYIPNSGKLTAVISTAWSVGLPYMYLRQLHCVVILWHFVPDRQPEPVTDSCHTQKQAKNSGFPLFSLSSQLSVSRSTTAPLFYRPFVSTVFASRAFYYSASLCTSSVEQSSTRSANTFSSFRRWLKHIV